MLNKILENLKHGENLEMSAVEAIFDNVLSGVYKNSEIADLLVALADKTESASEIAGAAKSMKKHADQLDTGMKLLDTCGTGGDGKSTFNISTAASIVCSLFVPVAKHGNRAVSSKSGSADVLDALDIPINLKKQAAFEYLKKNGFVFLFAPNYHPAMKYAAPVRKQIGIRTIFNLIGPLCNPFNVSYQTIGVFNRDFLPVMLEASDMLDMNSVIFLSSKDGLDEVSISDITVCYQKQGLNERQFEFDPRELGIYADISAIKGYDAKINAKIMMEVFENKHNKLRNAVAINAAFGLAASGVENNIKNAFSLAKETMENGKALDKIESLKVEEERIDVA